MKDLFKDFKHQIIKEEVDKKVEAIKNNAKNSYNVENLKKAFSFIDLTFLSCTDNNKDIAKIVSQVNKFSVAYPEMPNIAAICVYPTYIELIHKNLKPENIKLASVVGGFPASQTFLEIKTQEARLAIQRGGDEADMVISVGEFLNQEYQLVFHEIYKIKHAAGDATLKVILETGAIQDYTKIYKASILAMEAGADFIKTSTGKEKIGATPEAVYVMAVAIKDFYEKTGKKIGLKPAGGVSSGETAIFYMSIIKTVLGDEWLKPELFRFGTSSLANKLLKEIYPEDKGFFGFSNSY